MAFDRDGTLRKAEKLLRQGRLDLAIAEYRSVIDDQPSDWNTANILGDLYFRAGQKDKAVAEYSRIADHLASEGFFPKAAALYRKILKIKPDEERALWHLGQIAARQGLLVDARTSFLTLAELRRARGDRRGEAEAWVRLGDLNGADVETRLAGARARVELGHVEPAVAQLKQLALDLQEKGREADALAVLQEASAIAPQDVGLKRGLMSAYAARGDFETASRYATSAAELNDVAEELFRLGRSDEALGVLAAAAEADPGNMAIRARLVRAFVTRGDMARVRALLTPEVAGSDPELLWVLAEMELRDGRMREGTVLLQQILDRDPGRRDELVILGCAVAEVNPDAGYGCIEVAAQAAIAVDEWGSAAAALNEFVNRVHHHIPALMRLVEICVDGGLEATMHSAQAQLADAYLVTGMGLEARVIAEDLVAREPWERANIERFRRALTLLGETDIDGIIAERLSGQSPFMSTDFLWPDAAASPESPAMEPPPVEASPLDVEPPAEPALSIEEDAAAAEPEPRAPAASPHAIDLRGIFDEDAESAVEAVSAAPPEAEPEAEPEVDLSDVLLDLKSAPAVVPPQPPARIEDVLRNVRSEVAHDAASPEVAEQHLSLAVSCIQMGSTEEAMRALEVAARSPRHRFRAGALLAKLHLDSGNQAEAIDWFERAAEAPAPSPAAAHQLLYELAAVLESQGEASRALAVLLELQAEAGEYRDLAERLDRLTKVQMGG